MGDLEGMDRLEKRVKPFEDATPFLPQPERLQAMAERDGFVYLHKLVPEDLILALRGVVLDYAREAGWLAPNAAPGEALAFAGRRVGGYQEDDWVSLQVRVQNQAEMWAVGDHVAIHRALRAVSGRSSYLCLSTANTCRVFSPHPDMAAQPHQDAHYFRLIDDFWTVWLPLGDCPRDDGPLALLAGSHHNGLRDHTGLGIVDGGVVVPEDTVWTSGDFSCGDAVLFRPLTLHRSLPNRSETRLRLSADFRYGFWDDTSPIDWRSRSAGSQDGSV